MQNSPWKYEHQAAQKWSHISGKSAKTPCSSLKHVMLAQRKSLWMAKNSTQHLLSTLNFNLNKTSMVLSLVSHNKTDYNTSFFLFFIEKSRMEWNSEIISFCSISSLIWFNKDLKADKRIYYFVPTKTFEYR